MRMPAPAASNETAGPGNRLPGVAPDTLSRRVNAERLVLLGWSRAILLQLAHPLVAAGVADHSGFRASPAAAFMRLHSTVRSMLALTFGDEEQRERTLEHIRTIHRRVNGHLAADVGPYPAGTRYSAEDPALVLWVHATLLDSVPLVYDLLVRRLGDDERDTYCREAAPVAIALGAREQDVPTTWSALRAYLDRMYGTGAPPGAAVVAPAGWINDLLTIGLLPEPIREGYGFTWSPGRQRALLVLLTALRQGRRLMPDAVALWRGARRG